MTVVQTKSRKEGKNSRSKVSEVENSEEDVAVSKVARESTVVRNQRDKVDQLGYEVTLLTKSVAVVHASINALTNRMENGLDRISVSKVGMWWLG